VAVPGAGGGSPGLGENAVQLGMQCFHLAAKIFDIFPRIVILGGGATLTSDGWRPASIMRSAQRAAVSKSPLGWLAMTALIWEGSRLDQVLRSKSSGMAVARLQRCLRNWDGLRSPVSFRVRSSQMQCSLKGDSCLTSSVLSVV
jgi:hypothetical protein